MQIQIRIGTSIPSERVKRACFCQEGASKGWGPAGAPQFKAETDTLDLELTDGTEPYTLLGQEARDVTPQLEEAEKLEHRIILWYRYKQ